MATKLYLRRSTASNKGGTLPSTEQSSLTPDANLFDGVTLADNRALSTEKSTVAQTSLVNTSTGDTASHNYYIARWVSNKLNQTSIAANTWNYKFAASESNAAANFPRNGAGALRIVCYVWKPSNGTKYGDILDGNSAADFEEAGTSQTLIEGTFSGAAVSGLTAGDAVIVFEAWAIVQQGSTTARTQTVFYDGTTESSTSNNAAHIETPENLSFLPDITKPFIYPANITNRAQGKSVLFDGVDDNINLGNHSDLWSQAKTKFSFSYWIYATDGWAGTTRTVLNHSESSNHGFRSNISSTTPGRIQFAIRDSTGTTKEARNDTLTLNAWNHIVGTFDSTLGSANVKIYVNNVVGAVTPDLTETPNLSATLLIADTTNDFKGNLRDFRFWNSIALDSTQRADVMNNSPNAPTPDYWIKMDEGTGNPVDIIKGKTTTISGATWETRSPVALGTKSFVHKFNIQKRIQKAFVFPSNIIKRVQKAFVYPFNVEEGLARIEKAFIYSFNVTTRVSKSFIYPSNIFKRIQKAFVYPSNIIERVKSSSILFDGTNDFLQAGNQASLWSASLTKFSFTFWVYATAGWDTNSRYIVLHNTASPHGFGCFIHSSVANRLTFRIVDAASINNDCWYSSFQLNRWNFVACIYDSTLGSNNMKIYVNGLAGGTNTLTETISLSSALNLSSSTNDLQGNFKDFRWYTTKALTTTEIDDIMANNASAPTPDYWLKMQEGSGSAVDSISRSLTATLQNGASWVNGFSPIVWAGKRVEYIFNITTRISKSFIYPANIAKRIQKVFIYPANITERVQKAFVYPANIVGRISKIFTYPANIVQRTSKLFVYPSNIIARITKSFIYPSNIVERITKSFVFPSNITSRITKSFVYPSNIIKRVEKAFVYPFNIAQAELIRIEMAFIYAFNTLERVSQPYTYPSNITTRISKEFIYQWNLVQRTIKQFVYSSNIEQRIQKSFIYPVNILERISQQFQYPSNISARVEKVFVYSQNILQRIIKSFVYPSNVVERVSNEFGYRFDVVQRIIKQFVYPSNIVERVSKSFVYPANIVERTIKQFVYQFNITNKVQMAFQYPFNIVERVQNAFVYPFDIASALIRIEMAFIYPFNVVHRTSQEFNYKFNITTKVEKAFIYSQNIMQRISQSFTYPSNILTRISLQFVYQWNLLQRIVKSFTYPSNIQQRVENAFIYSVNILQRVQKAFVYPTNILQRVTKQFVYPSNITVRVEQTFDYLFNVVQRVSLAFVYPANIQAAIARIEMAFTYSFNVAQRISNSFHYPSNITSRIEKIFVFPANIVERISKPFTYSANIVERIEKAFEYPSNIVERVSKEFTYPSNIMVRVEKIFEYSFNVMQRISKTFVYPFTVFTDLIRIEKAFVYAFNVVQRTSIQFVYPSNITVRITKSFIYPANIIQRTIKSFVYKFNIIQKLRLTSKTGFVIKKNRKIPGISSYLRGLYNRNWGDDLQ